MTLSNLITKEGLSKHMTATSATIATPEVTDCVSVAGVATVAVTTSLEAENRIIPVRGLRLEA